MQRPRFMSTISTALVLMLGSCVSAPPAPAPRPTQQTGGLEHRMANCPSAVAGAITSVVDAPDGVFVTVTAKDPDSQSRLFALAEVHGRIEGPEGNAPEHTGLHGGPGDIGHCPIVHVATRVSFTRIPGGVRFHVRALGADGVKALQDDTRARASRVPAWIANE